MTKKPKIAVIGKKNYLYWDDHVVDAFSTLGCEVAHFQINSRQWHTQFARGITKGLLGKKIGNKLTDKLHAHFISSELQKFAPDMVFFTSAYFIPEIFYEMANSLPNRPIIASWDGDGGAYVAENKKYSHLIDVLFETEKIYCNENILGLKKMVHLPFCVNPKVHKDTSATRIDRVYFCGAWSPVRDSSICAIKDFQLLLKGWKWDKLSCRSSTIQIESGTVDMPQQVNDYSSSLAVLNKHQEVNHIQALNMRTFEAPGCGALLINDYRDELPFMYDIGEEVVAFRDDNELCEVVKWVFENKDAAMNIAKKGYQRTLSEHTYKHRMQKVLLECGF